MRDEMMDGATIKKVLGDVERMLRAGSPEVHYDDSRSVNVTSYSEPWERHEVVGRPTLTISGEVPPADVKLVPMKNPDLLSEEGAPVKKQNQHRFYVSRSPMVTPVESYLRLKDAVAGAQRLVAMTGDKYVVLQMVRVVRRKPQPIVVEQP